MSKAGRTTAWVVFACLSAVPAFAKGLTVRNSAATVTVSDSNWRIVGSNPKWVLSGALPDTSATPMLRSGADRLGSWREIDATSSARTAGIRVYRDHPVILFLDTRTKAAANTRPFPAIDALPPSLMKLGYAVDTFAKYQFGQLGEQGPWILFDADRHTMVLSPADHFLVSSMQVSADGKATSGIDAQIQSLPAGFTHSTMLVFGDGIEAALHAWGSALQAMGGRQPVPNDADVVLNKFGYWTDNGTTYYYKFVPALGYEGTLLAVRDQFRKLGVPIGYLQLDSWWYPKANGNQVAHTADNGTLVYRADPTVFPNGLEAFHQQLGLPLATHARWIAESSPYRKEYRFSNNVIVDSRFWNSTADYLHRAGVVVYEQDWLNKNARPAINLQDGHAFLADMAKGMGGEGIAIQYCMPLPGYFLASSQLADVQTIRTSPDRFGRSRWDEFLYGSALARSVGLWPWTDAFMSKELPNLIISVLSAGPVGVGDALGAVDVSNLKRAMRADSVLLKPDTSLLPSDATILSDAQNKQGPMIAVTHSGEEKLVFAYPRQPDRKTASISLQELGIPGPVYAYDWARHSGQVIQPRGSLTLSYSDGWAYEVLAPVTSGGVALLGDTEAITPLAEKRFASVSQGKTISATVVFAPGESSVSVTGYADHAPTVTTRSGEAGAVHYDRGSQLFTFTLRPAAASTGGEARFELQ